MRLRNSESGQTLIVILVIMVVSLTIGLSVASRSIVDVRLSTQGEQSQRAFSAAEAGIEDALRNDLGTVVAGGGTLTCTPSPCNVGGVPYTVTVTQAAAADAFATDKRVIKNDIAQINTKTLTSPTQLEIYWVDSSATIETTTPQASLAITEVYYDTAAAAWKLKKYAFNPPDLVAGDIAAVNGFTQTSGCLVSCQPITNGKTYSQKHFIDLTNGSEIVRLKPVYNGASIAVKVTGCPVAPCLLPPQSYTVESTSTVGGVTRKIQIQKSIEALPPIFDFVLFSGSGSISK